MQNNNIKKISDRRIITIDVGELSISEAQSVLEKIRLEFEKTLIHQK